MGVPTEAVLFDAGNTLLWIDHGRIARMLAAEGVPASEEAVRVAEMRARPRLDPLLAGASRRESREVAARYADLVLADVADPCPPRVREAILGGWYELWTVPGPGARETLDVLAARGLKLGVVSNSNGTVAGMLERAGLATHLGCVVDSGAVGVEKPDPRIFAIAAQRLGVAAAACVYVGDFYSIDVRGARAAGMEGVLLDPIGAWGEVDARRIASLDEVVDLVTRSTG